MVTRRGLLQTGVRAGLGLGVALLAAQYGNGVDPGMGLRTGPHVIAAQAAGTPILQLFYRGADGQLWTVWQKADQSWSAFESLGGSLTTDPVAEKVPGTDILHVFYRGPDGAVWTLWRTPDGTWSKHVSLGGFLPTTQYGPAKPIAMQVPGANVLQLFYRGQDMGLYTRWRGADGTWAPKEQRLSPSQGQPGSQLGGDPVVGPFAQVFYGEPSNFPCGGSFSTQPLTAGPVPGILGGQGAWRRGRRQRQYPQGGAGAGHERHTGVLQGASILLKTRWSTPTGWSDEQGLPTASSGPDAVGLGVDGYFDNLAVAQVPGTDLLQVFARVPDQSIWTQSRTPDGQWPQAWPIAGVRYDPKGTGLRRRARCGGRPERQHPSCVLPGHGQCPVDALSERRRDPNRNLVRYWACRWQPRRRRLYGRGPRVTLRPVGSGHGYWSMITTTISNCLGCQWAEALTPILPMPVAL